MSAGEGAARPRTAGTALRVVGSVGGLELRRLVRDRANVFFLVALPLLIITVLSLGGGPGGPDRLPVAVLDRDGGPAGAALVALLEDRLEVQREDDLDALRAAVGGEARLGVVVPEDYTERLEAGRQAVLRVVEPADPGLAAPVRPLLDAALREQTAAVAAAGVAVTAGLAPAEALAAAREAARALEPSRVVTRPVGESGIFSGPERPLLTQMVLFVFLVSLASSASVLESRELGVARRALASPVRPATLLVGFGLARVLVAGVQAAVLVTAGALLFGVTWGDPLATGVLLLALSLSAGGLGLLAGTVFRTSDQAGATGWVFGLGLAMLGGCLWPLEIVPAALQVVGRFTPHAWALDGLYALVQGGGLAAVAVEVAVLVGFAAVFFAAGAARLRPALRR